jgi:hypothetical protein
MSEQWGFGPIVCLALTFRLDKAQVLDIDLNLFYKLFTAIKTVTKVNVIKQVIRNWPQTWAVLWSGVISATVQTAVNTFNGINRLVFVKDTHFLHGRNWVFKYCDMITLPFAFTGLNKQSIMQRIPTQQLNCWKRCFLCGPCRGCVASMTERGLVYIAPGRIFSNLLHVRYVHWQKAKPIHKRQIHFLIREDVT